MQKARSAMPRACIKLKLIRMSILSETENRITTITIDRPLVRNAIDGAAAHALAHAFRIFDADTEADVAILRGSRHMFCAGADLKAFSAGLGHDSNSNPLERDLTKTAPMGPTRMLLSKPVIASVAGYAVAGGMELALWCDLRVMEEDAVFGIFCRRWGVPLIDGGTVRLPRLIGMSHALDLILTGRPVKGPEALAMGLANRLVAPGGADDASLAMARLIAGFPARCMKNDRLSAYEQEGLAWDAALANEFARGMDTLADGQTLAGARRFANGAGRHGDFS